jgi:hypothetical protein
LDATDCVREGGGVRGGAPENLSALRKNWLAIDDGGVDA